MNSKKIIIVDYGMGNLGSILNMMKKIGINAVITSNVNLINEADKLILPGVGAFDNAIKNLMSLGLVDILNKKVIDEKVPILGICLGIQLFTKRSDEGTLNGFGWIDAETMAFSKYINSQNYKIPHMGWNSVLINKNHHIFNSMPENPRFYFVHSYHVVCNHHEDALTTTNYGIDFISSIQRENIIGVQFHPEKSHKFGMCLLKNFVEWQYSYA